MLTMITLFFLNVFAHDLQESDSSSHGSSAGIECAALRQLFHPPIPGPRRYQLASAVGYLGTGAVLAAWVGWHLCLPYAACMQAAPLAPESIVVGDLQRTTRSLLVIAPLAAVMLFPIGIFTGALSNLSVAVCGGTPGE